MASGVELQVEDAQYFVLLLAIRAAQYGLNSSNQLPGGEGLGYIVIHTLAKALHFVVLAGLGGEHNDGEVAGDLIAAQPARQFDAAAAWEHPVQEHQIRLPIDYRHVRVMRIRCGDTAEASQVEGDTDHVANSSFIVDY